ncbi:DUF7490 domain-containing protein [Methanolobus profundi]|uniref:Uncharacterized protein n=1 Tax=Methanolobus profundi TaxID=487685 RepID=A0A1I4SY34_9EURY|nr:PGF-CTERM sorting domain-containing protein [Methanolobus profundi]SFM69317.1 hypothetical protein SAMN04488696_2075 [Methanolobus profundi]
MIHRRTIYSFLVVLFILCSTVSSGCLREFEEQEAHMGIRDIEIASESVKSTYAWFNVTTYVENWGADSDDNATVMLKVFNQQTGLLELKQEADIGPIKSDETKTVSQTIHLPKSGSYRISATIINDGEMGYDLWMTLSGLENLPTDQQETGIQIEGIDFIAREASSNGIVIENDIYLKNEGVETTEDYRILVKAREMDARLIADKEWTSSGEIQPEDTIIRSVNLTVPDNYNYVVEVSIWDGNTVVQTGEDYVQLNPEKVIDRDQMVQNKNVDTADFVVEDDFDWAYDDYAEETAAEESPGFTAIFTATSLITALYIIRRRAQ